MKLLGMEFVASSQTARNLLLAPGVALILFGILRGERFSVKGDAPVSEAVSKAAQEGTAKISPFTPPEASRTNLPAANAQQRVQPQAGKPLFTRRPSS